MDIPAGWIEQVQNIDWGELKAKVADYGPLVRVVRGTWSHETIEEIASGHLYVPDDVINEALERRVTEAHEEGSSIEKITLTSHENGRLDIYARSEKGEIELSGEIKEFIHQGDKSYAVYRVRERNLPGHGLASWIFSRISLSMAERLTGKIDFPEDIPVTIKHNTVTVDFSQVLADSDFGQSEYKGHRLMDMVEIKGATPKEGGIDLETELDVPDDIKDDLKSIFNIFE